MEARISGERAAHNESLYRSINERIEEFNEAFATAADDPCEWICECADTECTLRIVASMREYEAVRADGSTFIVTPGHLYPEVERVVGENDRFMTVEKVGAAGRRAELLDPRQDAD